MIRRAMKKDIDEINELGCLLNNNFVNLFNMEEILNEEISKVFVYVEHDKVIAFLHITELYETVDIINIVVDPEHRKMKVATVLMDYMITDINPEVNLITLEVSINNKDAINLYKKFGFEIVNTRKSYYKDEDAYLMGRFLE